MNTQDAIVSLARDMHRRHWTHTSDVSKQTKSANSVCRAWQQAVRDNFQDRFTQECVVGTDCSEKIDLVDHLELVAYELKVSPNNTHFEFYRDVFKVWIQREIGMDPLKKLVFITPEAGAKRLARKLGREVITLAAKHGFEIEVVAI